MAGHKARRPLLEALPARKGREKPLLRGCRPPLQPPRPPDGEHPRAVEKGLGLQDLKAALPDEVSQPFGAERGADSIGHDPPAAEKLQKRAIAQPDQRIERIVEREQQPPRRAEHADNLLHRLRDVGHRRKMIERGTGIDHVERGICERQCANIGYLGMELWVPPQSFGHDHRRDVDAAGAKSFGGEMTYDSSASHLVKKIGLEGRRLHSAGMRHRALQPAVEQGDLEAIGVFTPQSIRPGVRPLRPHAVPVGALCLCGFRRHCGVCTRSRR